MIAGEGLSPFLAGIRNIVEHQGLTLLQPKNIKHNKLLHTRKKPATIPFHTFTTEHSKTMKIRTLPILNRFTYDPDLIPLHGTPLFDLRSKHPVHPQTSVRIGRKIVKPKQIVYLLHNSNALMIAQDSDGADPEVTLPKYILHRDGNENNIRIENLQASARSTRWQGKYKMIETSTGLRIPRDQVMLMTPEELERYGVTPDDLLQ